MVLEISKCYSYSCHLILPKLYKDVSDHNGIEAINFLGDLPKNNYFVAPLNFTWESMGKL